MCGDFCSGCPGGQICNDCATGSCPGCEDCVAACVEAPPGECDDHQDCVAGERCVFTSNRCEPECDAAGCADPNLVCVDCATSSGPCLKDCLSVCLPL